MNGSWCTPEAILYTYGKPSKVGSPLTLLNQGLDMMAYEWNTQWTGRPGDCFIQYSCRLTKHSAPTSGRKRHSCLAQRSLRQEGVNHSCPRNSKYDGRPAQKQTNVSWMCNVGTSPTEQNSRESQPLYSIGHHRHHPGLRRNVHM